MRAKVNFSYLITWQFASRVKPSLAHRLSNSSCIPAASIKDGHGNVIARAGLVSSNNSKGTISSLYLTLAVEGEAEDLVTRYVCSGFFIPSHLPSKLICEIFDQLRKQEFKQNEL